MEHRIKRPVKIANCSGAATDLGVHMYNQAYYGDVDVITGDYLAELNLASAAEDYAKGTNPGWISSAWDGLQQTLDIAHEKRIKIVINGGGLNPEGLAEKTYALVKEKGLRLKVAYVDGDNLMHKVDQLLHDIKSGVLTHLDQDNEEVQLIEDSTSFMDHPSEMPIVCANAYLGYRAIKKCLDREADIVICGRVADASPVIAAAAWWHSWSEDDYTPLAGAFVGGHLIECSTYITGANFAGSYKYPIHKLMDLGLPIVEVAATGECTVTKHEALGGIVTVDTVKCQLLYELQGNIYLNSDVKADIKDIDIKEESTDRIQVTGIIGFPPPPTTKLAIFYRAGYQSEILLNASGYATDWKWNYHEMQVRRTLEAWGILSKFDVLDFQRVGTPMENPRTQLSSTTYMRIFAQARDHSVLGKLAAAEASIGMAHFAGMHWSTDMRTAIPKPFLGFYPATIPQSELEEAVNIIDASSIRRYLVGPPSKTEPLQPRENYDPAVISQSFGPTIMRPLGDIALGRSGDKGANVNLGLYVTQDAWEWFRTFMTRARVKQLMGDDWKDWYFVERVEMTKICAVHFVIYGPLGRGISSSKLLDGLGKGFAEYIRAVHVPIPVRFLEQHAQDSKTFEESLKPGPTTRSHHM
ncbi:DUF1446-domain-containing protein [Pseudovirgaria hyperparasitica]|uniref:DUF1446-domain-containing protein n=1 Tax=Pseudovirgaria hyperparasitica TaxID=470096 RepID=A0A6A6VTX7_9PEZI|nr:DUF1446-domain-containing protein [Pseudovirgaria hyperparasitica]KAF2753060.1 DUF1446-domain-containing protein [Pseudovirgaria hyperparasitica]